MAKDNKSKGGRQNHSTNKWLARLKSTSVIILLILGSLIFSLYVVIHWAERQILTPNNYVELVSPLPKQPVVYNALGSYISDQIFSSVDVQNEISDALPPKISFIAGPLTSQIKTITTKTAQKVVASDGFQTIWISANRLAINRIVSTANGQVPPVQQKIQQKFKINLNGASGQLSSALGKVGSALPALQPASHTALNVTTNLHTGLKRLSDYVKIINFLADILPLIIIACLLWAITLAKNRRKMLMITTIVIGVLMLLELVGLKGVQNTIVDNVKNKANIPAVEYIYGVLVGWLRHMLIAVTLIMATIYVLCLLSGPASWARSFRELIHIPKLKSSIYYKTWLDIRVWVRQHLYYIWLGIFIIALIILAAFISFSSRSIINTTALIISLFALTRLIATPHYDV